MTKYIYRALEVECPVSTCKAKVLEECKATGRLKGALRFHIERRRLVRNRRVRAN
jgi:hypothetical protein